MRMSEVDLLIYKRIENLRAEDEQLIEVQKKCKQLIQSGVLVGFTERHLVITCLIDELDEWRVILNKGKFEELVNSDFIKNK